MNISQTIESIIGRLLGLGDTQTIEGYEPSLAAPWAHDAPAWLFFGCLGLAAVAVLFYARYQRQKHVGARVVLAICRAVVLCLLLLMLAQPILTVTVSSQKLPSFWFLFDGTDSMAIADEFAGQQRSRLDEAVGLANGQENSAAGGNRHLARADYVKALLQKEDKNLLAQLQDSCRIRAFLFDRPDGVRSLELSADGRQEVDGKHLAEQLTTEGEVSAIGAALDDLARRHATGSLAGLVIFSDFDQNAGPAALAAADRLGVKIFTVGIGATAAVDVAVGLQAPLILKKDERATITVTLRQQRLDGEEVEVVLSAQPIRDSDGEPIPIGQKTVVLEAATQDVNFPYEPAETGRFTLQAEVKAVPGEVVSENNAAEREVTVRDDFLRLLFVEYEPSWEWRFVKEVFHRDELVGMRGFRTFLRSSDPRVRDANPMFLPTMSPTRSEFFANDVIFLGDMPASALSPRFCEMTKEFVSKFGGGLVVVSGPRFGPGQLAETPLEELLPVKFDPKHSIRDRKPFRLELTEHARQFDFMQLGSDEAESRKAWDNLGLLPWYHPVQRLHPLATALAEHPEDLCVDSEDNITRQPLIAIRRYGRGEVIYLGFNETWRLRRKYGELYYRQFWGQMIHRLGLSHALGSQKRFVLRTDRRRYRADDHVLLTVEAYDDDFQPLTEDELRTRGLDARLRAELILPAGAAAEEDRIQPLNVAQLREGVFEARFPVFAGGEHRIQVKDPITGDPVETTFQVTSIAVERQNAVRNVALAQQLADVHPGGKSYDLTNIGELAEQIHLTPKTETMIEIIPLWHTWLCFGCVVGLLLGEWLLRKWVNLP